MKRFVLLLACVAAAPLSAAEPPELVGLPGFMANQAPPPIPREENRDVRRVRNYPDQPPTIPHTITGYQIDLSANKCLSCHSRKATESSQAPMISVTHFVDREGQTRAAVSPRRYFCTQCHVSQAEAKPLVENRFEDIDSLLAREIRK